MVNFLARCFCRKKLELYPLLDKEGDHLFLCYEGKRMVDIEKSVKNLLDKIHERFGVSAERLVELAKADKEGRIRIIDADADSSHDSVWVWPPKEMVYPAQEIQANDHKDGIWME